MPWLKSERDVSGFVREYSCFFKRPVTCHMVGFPTLSQQYERELPIYRGWYTHMHEHKCPYIAFTFCAPDWQLRSVHVTGSLAAAGTTSPLRNTHLKYFLRRLKNANPIQTVTGDLELLNKQAHSRKSPPWNTLNMFVVKYVCCA